MRVVRLTTRQYPDLSGKGAALNPGRWNSLGKPVVYTADCEALAVLEYVVHTDSDLWPTNLLLLDILIPEDVEVQHVNYTPTDLLASRDIGDSWLDSKATLVLDVPSVLVPRHRNYLINPEHPAAKDIKISGITPFAFDSRLITF